MLLSSDEDFFMINVNVIVNQMDDVQQYQITVWHII